MAASGLLAADRLRISCLRPILGQLQHEELAWDRRGLPLKAAQRRTLQADDACGERICLGRVKFRSKPSIPFALSQSFQQPGESALRSTDNPNGCFRWVFDTVLIRCQSRWAPRRDTGGVGFFR